MCSRCRAASRGRALRRLIRNDEGVERRAAPPNAGPFGYGCRPLRVTARPLAKGRCASRRSIAAFSLRRRAALSPDGSRTALARVRPSVSASSWQGAVVPPGGAPTPPGMRACETRPRAPHRPSPGIARCRPPERSTVADACPGSSRLATPRESAPQWTRYAVYSPSRNKCKEDF